MGLRLYFYLNPNSICFCAGTTKESSGGAEGEKSFVHLFILQTPCRLFANEFLIISFSPGRRIDVDVIFQPAGCAECVDSFGASSPSIGDGGRYSFFLSLFRSLCLYLFWVTRPSSLAHNFGVTSADGICLPSSVTDPSNLQPKDTRRRPCQRRIKDSSSPALGRKPTNHLSETSPFIRFLLISSLSTVPFALFFSPLFPQLPRVFNPARQMEQFLNPSDLSHMSVW